MKLTIETTDASLIRTLGSILSGNPPIKVARSLRQLTEGKIAQVHADPATRTATLQQMHQRQGRYLAYIRHLSQRNRRLVKAHRAGHGLVSAIAYAQSLGAKPHELRSIPKAPKLARKHRRKCDWCKRGFLAKQSRSHFCTKRCRDASYHAIKKEHVHLPTYVPPKVRPKDKGVTLLPGDPLTSADHAHQ